MNECYACYFAWLGESRGGGGYKIVSGGSLKSCGFANNYPLRSVTSLTLWIATMKLKWRKIRVYSNGNKELNNNFSVHYLSRDYAQSLSLNYSFYI